MVNIEYLLGIALDKLPFMAFSIALEKVWFLNIQKKNKIYQKTVFLVALDSI